MQKTMAFLMILSATFVPTVYGASFDVHRSQILLGLGSKFGMAQNLNAAMVGQIREFPGTLGKFVDVSEGYGVNPAVSDTANKNETLASVENGVLKVMHTVATNQEVLSKTYCPADMAVRLKTLVTSGEPHDVDKQIDDYCFDYLVISNIGEGEGQGNIPYEYDFDLRSEKIAMRGLERRVQVFILDRSRDQVAQAVIGGKPVLGSRTNLNPEFELSEPVFINRDRVIADSFTQVMGQLEFIELFGPEISPEKKALWDQFVQKVEATVKASGLRAASRAAIEGLRTKIAAIVKDSAQDVTTIEEKKAKAGYAGAQAEVQKLMIRNNELKALASILERFPQGD